MPIPCAIIDYQYIEMQEKERCVSMGILPCEACTLGWCTFTTTKSTFCQDTCEYFKRYLENLTKEQNHGMVEN